MEVALAQTRVAPLEPGGTLEAIVARIGEAEAMGCRLVVFPGRALVAPSEADIERIAAASRGITAVLGAASRHEPLAVAADRVIVAHQGRPIESTGPAAASFSIDATAFCASTGGPPVPASCTGADWSIHLATAPYRHLEAPSRREKAVAWTATHRAGLLFVNAVGDAGEDVLDGGSFAVRADGHLACHAPFAEAGLSVFDTDGSTIPWPEASPMERLRDVLTLGLRRFVASTGLERVIVGLSGGIDSAVVASLAARALGPDAVTAVFLPSRFTAAANRNDASEIARCLGTGFLEISIETLHQAARAALPETPTGTVDENLQPRLRAVILMALANLTNALVLCPGNRSEIAMGYNTLYGDTIGAVAPIADLYKEEVYALGRLLSEGIPASVFAKPPSAELRPGQRDDDDLPPYELLDPLLAEILDRGAKREDLLALGHPAKRVDEVLSRMRVNAFKHRQLPPKIRVRAELAQG